MELSNDCEPGTWGYVCYHMSIVSSAASDFVSVEKLPVVRTRIVEYFDRLVEGVKMDGAKPPPSNNYSLEVNAVKVYEQFCEFARLVETSKI